MKFLPKKLNLFSIFLVVLNLGFFALIAYEGYSLYNLYNTLNVREYEDVTKRAVRIDFGTLDKAAERYKTAQGFEIPPLAPEAPQPKDPFANNVPVPTAR